MGIDLTTAYIVLILFIATTVFADYIVFRQLPQNRHLPWLMMYMGAWLLTAGSILLQAAAPIAGQLLVQVIAILIVYSIVALVHSIAGDALPKIRPFVIYASFYIPIMFAEILIFESNIARALFGSSTYLVSHMWAFYLLKKKYMDSADRDSILRTNTVGLLTYSLLIMALMFFIRFLVGLSPFSNTAVGELMANNWFNVISTLIIPEVIFIINVAGLLIILKQENERRAKIARKFLIYESESLYAELINGLNHEINTPFGNANILISLLEKSQYRSDEFNRIRDLAAENLTALLTILNDRKVLLTDSSNNLNKMDIKESVNTLNRLMKRSFSSNKITYINENDISPVNTSYQHLFTILHSFAEIIQSFLKVETEKEVHIRWKRNSGVIEIFLTFDSHKDISGIFETTEIFTAALDDGSSLLSRVGWLKEFIRSIHMGELKIRSYFPQHIISFSLQEDSNGSRDVQ